MTTTPAALDDRLAAAHTSVLAEITRIDTEAGVRLTTAWALASLMSGNSVCRLVPESVMIMRFVNVGQK